MRQHKRGILVLASMILSISLMCGMQVVKATTIVEGGLNEAEGILLKDTNANGQIDEAHITVNCAAITANAIKHTTDIETTIGKFTVTDTGTTNQVSVSSIAFVSGDGTIAVFKLGLDEEDLDLSADTSGTALDIIYDATGSELKITDGSASVSVTTITSDVLEKDGAQPIILTAVDQSGTSLNNGTAIPVDANIIITFSEPMDTTALDENTEWSILSDPSSWLIPVWSNDDKTLTLELEQDTYFGLGESEEVTLIAPLAVSGVTDGNKELQNNPDNSAVSNPFSFTITDGTDDEDTDLPDGAVEKPKQPNPNSGVTLYRMPGDPRVYVIKNKKKHWIKTPAEFRANNYKWSEVQEISAELLEEYPEEENEEETSTTELLRAVGSHKVYKIEDGKKRWIKTAGEFNAAGYNWKNIQEVSPEAMASYQDAVLAGLLRAVGDHKVYKIEDGKKRWIKTAREFNNARYRWEEVEEVPAQDLEDYPDAE